ncbi:MAG TPA: glycosyltransferase family 4 protein [Chryseosolibacter sp.]|nr:glycosyltransferase family 4 protein [Chryseosolibacter sp.]
MALKILFLSHRFYPDVGGIEVNAEILAKAFHRAGHTVRLVTWSTDDNNDDKLPYHVQRNPDVFCLLKQHMWADVVYENNPCLRLSWPAYFFQKPVVVSLHTWVRRVDGSIKWQDKLKLRWLKRARSVIAVSDSIRSKCWPKAKVIANPYRADLFTVNGDLNRARDFVFVGRLVSDKGVDLAIKAFRRILKFRNTADDHHTLSFTIVGDGPDRSKLEDLVRRLGINSCVTFAGWLHGSSLASCLNDHKFILVPSVWEEPFGNVALEGMACGCIPIVSDGGGLPDAVGNAGLVFSRGNMDALVNCILNVLHDEVLQAKLRSAAPGHLASHHPEVVAGKYLNVIKEASE